jgi:alpha-mannosidase
LRYQVLHFLAEDREGIAVCMYDTEGVNFNGRMKLFFNLQNLKHTNIIEENPKAVDQIEVSHHGIET